MNFASELKQLLHAYATKTNDPILSAKLDAMVKLQNPNDVRILAFDVLKHVLDERKSTKMFTIINILLETLKQAETLANNIAGETLHFEWIDSDFVRAYTNGDWLLIEDVNICR
jgi:hypothetical protein